MRQENKLDEINELRELCKLPPIQPKVRKCLKCNMRFESQGNHNRLCDSCRKPSYERKNDG